MLQAIPGYSARRALFDHYVRTRADEERKEKRAAQKAAMEGFKQLLEEAKEVLCMLFWLCCHRSRYNSIFQVSFWLLNGGRTRDCFLINFVFQDIDHNTDYQTFKKKWGHDLRFEALERKERESLLNERYNQGMLGTWMRHWFCMWLFRS